MRDLTRERDPTPMPPAPLPPGREPLVARSVRVPPEVWDQCGQAWPNVSAVIVRVLTSIRRGKRYTVVPARQRGYGPAVARTVRVPAELWQACQTKAEEQSAYLSELVVAGLVDELAKHAKAQQKAEAPRRPRGRPPKEAPTGP